MITEEDLNNALLTVLSAGEPIPYTQSGIDYLLREVKKLLPDPKATITCQDIYEVSIEDKATRKAPKFYVSYQ